MKKRMFQILDEMNLMDIESGTETVGVSNIFLSGNMSKKGSMITMGAPQSVLLDFHSGKSLLMLVIVDKIQYDGRKDENEQGNNQNPDRESGKEQERTDP